MSLEEMRKNLQELFEKYERQRKREEVRRELMLKYYERIGSHSNPDEVELLGSKGETGLERIMNQIRILAEYGKDPEAKRLMEKQAIAFRVMAPRDFWNYLYDWALEAIELLKARRIKVPLTV